MEENTRERTVQILLDTISLPGNLAIPDSPVGLIIFAHGSGSSRFSPRNSFVAAMLHRQHFATLLFDLLSEEEDADYQQRFNIALLATRLVLATEWARQQADTAGLSFGYFGASTGAAAALCAAAALGPTVRAIVSRGGRPDLAGDVLGTVQAATLLIVGGADTEVLALNRLALSQLRAEKQLAIVPGATHLFEEPGALEQVAVLAGDWFTRYLRGVQQEAA